MNINHNNSGTHDYRTSKDSKYSAKDQISRAMEIQKYLQEDVTSPVQALRKELDMMRSELIWYENKYPSEDMSRKKERIIRLELICRSLEKCEPVDVMRMIQEKLIEAYHSKFNPDCACIWIPLRNDVPEPVYAKPAIIDLIGWDISTPYEYNYVGLGNAGGFICSQEEKY